MQSRQDVVQFTRYLMAIAQSKDTNHDYLQNQAEQHQVIHRCE